MEVVFKISLAIASFYLGWMVGTKVYEFTKSLWNKK